MLTPMAAGAATQCLTRSEADAWAVRQMKAEMTVLALACGAYTQLDSRGQYQQFVEKHGKALQSSAAVMRARFKREYGADQAQFRLDRYETGLANDASSRNMEIDGDRFCPKAVRIIADAVALDSKQLAAYSAATFAPVAVPVCGQARPVIRTAAAPAPAKPKAATKPAKAGKASAAAPARKVAEASAGMAPVAAKTTGSTAPSKARPR